MFAHAGHPTRYVNLGDVCFWLRAEEGTVHGGAIQDIYWVSRDSALLIRGGANYAYDQAGTGAGIGA